MGTTRAAVSAAARGRAFWTVLGSHSSVIPGFLHCDDQDGNVMACIRSAFSATGDFFFKF